MKKNKWIISVLVSFCLILSFSFPVFARPETITVPYGEESPSGYLSVPRVISKTKTEPEIEYYGTKNRELFVLPEVYDGRSKVNDAGIPYVLPARNQGNDSTCWAFSVCSTAETSMIKQNLLQKRTNLSPLQFAWFHYNRMLNPLGLSGPDRVVANKNILQTGGNEYLSTFALANWIGLVDEAKAPYENACAVASGGLRSSLCYAENMSCLKNALWITCDRFDEIKKQIMVYGSAMLPIYMNTVYYNDTTYGYYCNEKRYDKMEDNFSSNHMVTIVGWDDAFSRENFKTMPKKDGAWLVKNSWGEDWGMDGYFWISYYDKSIYDEDDEVPIGTTVTFLEMTQPDTWDNNYSYDGGGGIDWYYFLDDITKDPISSVIMANVYTAQYAEFISAVSFYTIQENVDYTIYVFCDVDDSISPTGGRFPSATVSGRLNNAGYHTIALPEEIELASGMKYTIAIELMNQDTTEPIKLLADGDGAWEWLKFYSQVGKGESYYREPGKAWVDVADDPLSEWCGNFRIHALTRLKYKELGDMNADGVINAKDALDILKVVAGLSSKTYWNMELGDLDHDKNITSEDALIVLKKIVGLID